VHVRRVFAPFLGHSGPRGRHQRIVLGIINGINVHELSSIGLKVFPVVILGGLDSIGGAIIGGLIIGLLETLRAVTSRLRCGTSCPTSRWSSSCW